MAISEWGIKPVSVLLAAFFLTGCGETARESAPAATETPVVTAAPAATPEPTEDDWLKIAREAMYDEDYEAALAALEELAVKSDEAEKLRARIYFEQGDAALDAGDFAAAIAFYRDAEAMPDAEGRQKLAEAMLRGDYMEAARAAVETRARWNRSWQDFILAYMDEPQTLDELLYQNRILSILSNRSQYYDPGAEALIESIDCEETHIHNWSYIGPITPYGEQEKLLLLSEGAAELERCGQGGGKMLIVRRQQDYPRGTVYATVDNRLGLIPPEREPASLDEVDYILYLDYDYSVCAVVAGNDGGMLEALQMSCVVRLVNEHSGEELYRSEKIMGAADYDNQYRLDFLAEDGWVACSNPPIGQALAEAIAALPEA